MGHYIKYLDWLFPPDKIRSGNLHLAASLLSSSLEVNSFTATVECEDPSILDFKRNSKLMYYPKAGPGSVWRVQNIERVAAKLYKISATSTLGLLVESRHYGGIYTGQTVLEVISDICGNVPFIVKSNLTGVKLYGWLPIASGRDNLSQVLFAIGATLKTDLNGVLRIEPLWDGISRAVGAERMYVESKVNYAVPITDVILTEHQYKQGSEERILHEGTVLEGDIVTFSEPMHSLTAEGLSILASGANWAKLSAGFGSLKGKVYIHNTREIVRHIQDAAVRNAKNVTDATLISLFNSPSAADRMANYYQWRETVDIPMIYQGEIPGDCVEGFRPFDHAETKYCLQSADITLSNTLKAQTKGLVGFAPKQIEEFVDGYAVEIILEDGEWAAQEDGEVIIVLIGGGRGGWSSFEGNAGSSQIGGKGGIGGAGGDGGRIFQFSLRVNKGEKFQAKIGKGGTCAGWIPGDTVPPYDDGPYGLWKNGHTTFGEFTSASGEPDENGFFEAVTNTTYAKPGKSGEPGADGGNCGELISIHEEPLPGKNGKNVSDPESGTIYVGGTGRKSQQFIYGGTFQFWHVGAGGGGAAVGENGKDAGAEKGGDGGNAKQPEKPSVRGTGGTGGHGGGGSGAGGYEYYGSPVNWPGGKGGDGVKGGDGADGAVIIYRKTKVNKPAGQFVGRDGKSVLDRLQRRFIV